MILVKNAGYNVIHIINKVVKDCQLHTDQHKNKILVLNCKARGNDEA